MRKILALIFITRPLIDLFWNTSIKVTNVAGILAIILCMLLYIAILTGLLKKNIYVNNMIVLFIIYCTIITLFTAKNFTEYDTLLRIISASIYIIYFSQNINEEKFEFIMKWYIVITIVPIVISILQSLGIIEYTYWDYLISGRIGRASGGYRQPSVLTRFLSFSNLYCYYFLSKYKNNKLRLKVVIYLIFSFMSIFLSYHRTGYLINIVILLFWFLIEFKQNLYKYIKIIFISLFLGMIIFIIANQMELIHITFEDFKRLVSIDNIVTLDDNGFNLVLRGRGNIIESLITTIKEQPWYSNLLGNGVGYSISTGNSMEIADMDFIRIVWNYGLLGLLIWFAIVINFMKIIKSNSMIVSNTLVYRLGLCSLFIFLCFGLTIEATTTPNFMYHIYLIFGYLYNISNSYRGD